MLYYIIKFIKLVLRKPRKMALHYGRLRREWKDACNSRLVNEMVYVTTKDWKTAYGSKNYSERIIHHIAKARYTIDVAMYSVSYNAICDALMRAHQRGVRVRLMCEIGFAQLREDYGHGIFVRKVTSESVVNTRLPTMHHKFCLIDGYGSKQRFHKGEMQSAPLTVAMTGSLNWVRATQNWDDLLITSAPKICRRLEQEFERMWHTIRC